MSTSVPESAGNPADGGATGAPVTRTMPRLSAKSQIFTIDDRTSTVAVVESTKSVRNFGAQAQRLGLVIALVALFGFFAIIEPQAFLSPINMRALAETAVPILIGAVAMTFILASGGIDLSVGSVIVLSGVTAQTYWDAMGGRDVSGEILLVGILIALATGVVCGLINGIIITRLDIPPLIATLGMMGAALGAAQLITGGQDKTNVPEILTEAVRLRPFGIPVTVFVALAIAILGAVILKKTRFGLRVLGIGSDERMLKRRGIGVDAYKVRIYALSGLLYAIIGILTLGRFSTTAIGGQTETPLVIIAAVVIGGTSLFGGSATMLGTLIGVLIPAVLYDGLVIAGIESYWQEVVIGIVLIVAVFFDQLQRRRRGT
ncbi:ABC transporter permease [Microbacterium trichothecenolyticum]|uniref:Ribose transport system permease protein RbsC n=1 Tax=Microbacterium trichothecenolyticum TaxID=69370 RepID=A0A0M2HC35_MICTR|nr:ABC transporter permease [Microbacterium trichothecenolyticum]KJL41668.1 Ribose transport system permease protein RbsC [Microbacterium trichothecenolyticum]